MKKLDISIISILIISIFSFGQCKKEQFNESTITLYDKPLSTIQGYIKGKWKLHYAYGGISVAKYPAKHNEYMYLEANRIVVGNDSAGVVVDTKITWRKDIDMFNRPTYLLSYMYTPGYAFPYYC